MHLRTWLRPLAVCLNRPRTRRAPHCPAFRPRVRVLEDRLTPSGGGLLDPTFGSGGAILNNPGAGAALYDVHALSGGELLAAGTAAGHGVAVRYNADGTFDTSFGSSGVATVTSLGNAYDIAVQPGSGGKILLASDSYQIVRLNSNGTQDTTFGAKGSKGVAVATPKPRITNWSSSMAVLSDGRFVLAGSSAGALSLARFNANGTLDTTFGNQGTVLTTIAAPRPFGGDHVVNVAVDGSGRLVVATTSASDFLVARFNANGSFDTTFGPAHTGVVSTDLGFGRADSAHALALQADGKILVAGGSSATLPDSVPGALVRYNPDGTLDTTFDQDGIALAYWDAGPGYSTAAPAKAMVVQPDGSILIAADGERITPNGADAPDTSLLMHFNPDGSRELSYGPFGTGVAAIDFGYAEDLQAMDLQADGRVVIVGHMSTEPPSSGHPDPIVDYFALARFTASSTSPSPLQVGSFTASSSTVTAGSPLTLTAGGVTTANAGATVTKVAFYAVDSSGIEQLLGYGTRNVDGTWTLAFTVNLVPGSYTLLALPTDSTGAISDPLTVNLNVT